MSHFEVIGYDDDGEPMIIDPDEVDGDVMGDVMGYAGPMGDFEGQAEVVGYDSFGDPIVVGARKRRRRSRRRGEFAVELLVVDVANLGGDLAQGAVQHAEQHHFRGAASEALQG